VLCIEKTKIGWKESVIKVSDEALKTVNMDELIKWKEKCGGQGESGINEFVQTRIIF
jgi:hypothetical protein